jgi:TolB protein
MSAAPQRPSQHINRIAFINLQGQLETLAPDGSERRMLSQANRFFQFPVWSPNGNHIAVIGGNRNGAGVFAFRDAADANEAAGQSLFNHPGQVPIYLNWAPDSQNLSFIAIVPPQQSFGLHVVSLDGQQHNHTLAVGRPCFWDWTPTGDQILLHLGFAGEQNARLTFIDPFKPKSAQASEDIAQPGLFQSPGISASGNYWAFARMNSEGESQLVIDGRGFDERVTLEHYGLIAMNWSPARDELAFISPPGPARTSYGPLSLVGTDGQPETITDDMVVAFFWSPDGRSIAYFTVANLYEQLKATLGVGPSNQPLKDMAEAANLGGKVKEPGEGDDRILRLNLWLADMDTGEHRLLLTFQPLDIFVNQFLPFFDQYALSHRIWSPDSNAIVLPVLEKEQAKILVIPTQSHKQKPIHIADGLMAFWSRQ